MRPAEGWKTLLEFSSAVWRSAQQNRRQIKRDGASRRRTSRRQSTPRDLRAAAATLLTRQSENRLDRIKTG